MLARQAARANRTVAERCDDSNTFSKHSRSRPRARNKDAIENYKYETRRIIVVVAGGCWFALARSGKEEWLAIGLLCTCLRIVTAYSKRDSCLGRLALVTGSESPAVLG